MTPIDISDSKYTLFDYGIDRNQLIEVHKRVKLDDVKRGRKAEAAEDDANKENEGRNNNTRKDDSEGIIHVFSLNMSSFTDLEAVGCTFSLL